MLTISPVLEPSSLSENVRRYWPLAVVAAILIAAIYISLIVVIDNTNLGTTNGLWKAPDVYRWEHRVSEPTDSGGLFYYPSYGILARFVPDQLMQFGARAPMVTFRKMAVLNAFFGGAASGFVFWLALRFTGSVWAAVIVTIAHAGAGFVLLNSINSEDIIPAYSLFLAATVCFIEFLYLGKVWLMAAWAFLFALTTLFHWTLMGPGLFAYGMTFLLLIWRRRSYALAGAAGLALFLLIVQLLVLRFHVPLSNALYPAKASGSGWIGFQPQKVLFCFLGIGNYFNGARNLVSYHAAFAYRPAVESMIVSWIFAVVTLGACLLAAFSRRTSLAVRCLAVFAIALFAAGELGDLYSQPQDPQMQIQPMFAGMAGLIILARGWFSTGSAKLRGWGAAAAAVVLLANGLANVRVMNETAGSDSRALTEIRELDQMFPHEKTTLVVAGFDGWTTWSNTVLWAGDHESFLRRTIFLATGFTLSKNATGQDAARFSSQQIDEAFARGEPVIAFGFWNQSPSQFADTVSTVTTANRAAIFDSLLRTRYALGRRGHIGAGDFVELLPGRSNASASAP